MKTLRFTETYERGSLTADSKLPLQDMAGSATIQLKTCETE